MERLLLSFIRLYSDPTFLVLILNTNPEEEVTRLFSISQIFTYIQHIPTIKRLD